MFQRSPLPFQTSLGGAGPAALPPQALNAAPLQAGPLPAGAVQGGSDRSRGLLPMLEVTIQRLEDIVDQETTALRTRQAIDLKDFNDRKSQALLELTRSLRSLQGAGSSPTIVARVASLQSKLAINRAVLKVHLEAVREISTTLSDAIRHADSDGTYTQAISAAYRRS